MVVSHLIIWLARAAFGSCSIELQIEKGDKIYLKTENHSADSPTKNINNNDSTPMTRCFWFEHTTD